MNTYHDQTKEDIEKRFSQVPTKPTMPNSDSEPNIKARYSQRPIPTGKPNNQGPPPIPPRKNPLINDTNQPNSKASFNQQPNNNQKQSFNGPTQPNSNMINKQNNRHSVMSNSHSTSNFSHFAYLNQTAQPESPYNYKLKNANQPSQTSSPPIAPTVENANSINNFSILSQPNRHSQMLRNPENINNSKPFQNQPIYQNPPRSFSSSLLADHARSPNPSILSDGLSSDSNPSQNPIDKDKKQGQVSFEVNLRTPRENLPSLSPNADQIWTAIQDPDEKLSYTQILKVIQSCESFIPIKEALHRAKFKGVDTFSNKYKSKSKQSTQPKLRDHVMIENIARHFSYFHRIFKITELMKFASYMRLDFKTFKQTIQPPQIQLFDLALNIIHTIVTKIRNYQQGMEVLRDFAELLVPQDFYKQRVDRSAIQYLVFIPIATDNGQPLFISIKSDCDTIVIFQMKEPRTVIMTFSMKDLIPTTKDMQLYFSPPTNPDQPTLTFQFIDKNALQCWTSTIALLKDSDHLFTFFASLQNVLQFPTSLPDAFINQFKALLHDPSMDVSRSICQIAKNYLRGDDYEIVKGAVQHLLSVMSESGVATSFIRFAFQHEIDHTNNPDTIFRESSMATMISGILLNANDNGYLESICVLLDRYKDNLNQAVLEFIKNSKTLNPMLRFIAHTSLHTTRRKFPKKLIPLSATSAIVFLRYLIPGFPRFSKELTVFGQRLMFPFVFSGKGDPKYTVDEKTYYQIANFIVDMSRAEQSVIKMPESTDKDLFKFVGKHYNEILTEMALLIQDNEHPIKFVILEFLENIFNGIDEVFQKRIANKVIFPSNPPKPKV